jgi:HSP20 family protein
MRSSEGGSPMTMQRWDPFSEMTSLRQAMDQLLEQSVIRPSSGQMNGQASGSFGFPMDVQEQGDALVVTASLPGVKPEDIDIQIQQNVLLITGEQREAQERQQGRYLLVERQTGRFSRALSLPIPVNADACEATVADGVLRLTLPKAEQARTKQISIRPASQDQLRSGQPANGTPAEPNTASRR